MPPTTGTTQDNAPSGARRFRRGRHVWPRHLRDLGVYLDDHGRRHVLTSEEQKRGEWVDSRANRRTEPRDEFHDDDGTVVYGDAAIRAGIERWAPELAATLPPLPTTPPLPPRAPQSIGAPRRTVQSSGRPRASATRPGAESGDSGDVGPGDEPPAAERERPRPFRWTGPCSGCRREADLETRFAHGARALCDRCAARPPRPSLARPVNLTDDAIRADLYVSDAEWAAWEAERGRIIDARRKRAALRREQDVVARTLDRLEARGLPVIYVGPELVASRCPLCNAGMGLRFHGSVAVDLTCSRGCDEQDIAADLRDGKGARR